MVAFERTDKTKWGVKTNLCCTNLAYTLEPCLSPTVSKRLVSVELPLILGDLAWLFGVRGGRKREGLTSCRSFQIIGLRGFYLVG